MKSLKRSLGLLPAVAALIAGTMAAPAAQAAASPYEKGPNPTESLVTASRGPFATSQTDVSSLVSGFGGGTIYYPTTTSEGTFGAIAISPGFTAYWSSLSWLGPRLASHGFVVIGIDTNSTLDQPASRGDQLLAALDYLTQSSSVRNRVDPNRLAVAGHSMGGGGSLEAAKDRTSLKAVIPLAPWNADKSWPEVRTPTLIIGGESDAIASVGSHSIPFYNSLSNTGEKAYLELDGAGHFFPNTSDDNVAKFMISWLKRWVDEDTRYTQFLCPAPSSGLFSDFSDARFTCPM
ncbi:alpha/beta hydrolase [Actinomadura craniellae]|uniref:Poly(ethylene terephthalate) hydrolase n=1 Tax=Actinomadura craniellae TaxID=2231787 RepID=A0A365H6Y8_9ACTN|nr:dienelactone hydrolase family protein [Actinomadura craniellae]RAY14880.1 alpha/beta hydrolase [Actinomadura craniellae]